MQRESPIQQQTQTQTQRITTGIGVTPAVAASSEKPNLMVHRLLNHRSNNHPPPPSSYLSKHHRTTALAAHPPPLPPTLRNKTHTIRRKRSLTINHCEEEVGGGVSLTQCSMGDFYTSMPTMTTFAETAKQHPQLNNKPSQSIPSFPTFSSKNEQQRQKIVTSLHQGRMRDEVAPPPINTAAGSSTDKTHPTSHSSCELEGKPLIETYKVHGTTASHHPYSSKEASQRPPQPRIQQTTKGHRQNHQEQLQFQHQQQLQLHSTYFITSPAQISSSTLTTFFSPRHPSARTAASPHKRMLARQANHSSTSINPQITSQPLSQQAKNLPPNNFPHHVSQQSSPQAMKATHSSMTTTVPQKLSQLFLQKKPSEGAAIATPQRLKVIVELTQQHQKTRDQTQKQSPPPPPPPLPPPPPPQRSFAQSALTHFLSLTFKKKLIEQRKRTSILQSRLTSFSRIQLEQLEQHMKHLQNDGTLSTKKLGQIVHSITYHIPFLSALLFKESPPQILKEKIDMRYFLAYFFEKQRGGDDTFGGELTRFDDATALDAFIDMKIKKDVAFLNERLDKLIEKRCYDRCLIISQDIIMENRNVQLLEGTSNPEKLSLHGYSAMDAYNFENQLRLSSSFSETIARKRRDLGEFTSIHQQNISMNSTLNRICSKIHAERKTLAQSLVLPNHRIH